MSIKPHPKKAGHFIIDCRPDGYKGKRVRLEWQGTEEGARKAQARILRKPVLTEQDTKAKIIAGIFNKWIVYYRNNRASQTADDAELCWSRLKTHFGRFMPKYLNREMIEAYKVARMKKVKPRTINKELSYFSSMLKWAAENNYCDPLPFAIKGFPKAMTRPPKPRPITQEQITNIYEAIEDKYKLVFLLMADAGLRRNEALHLKRSNLEMDHNLIYVTGKGSKERIVPITTQRLMHEIKKNLDKSDYLTINPVTKKPYLTIRKALLRAAKIAGIEKNVYHHLLRHSFGTNATFAGMDLNALQGMMGHSSPVTTGAYQHLAGEYLKKEGEKLESLVHVDKNKNG